MTPAMNERLGKVVQMLWAEVYEEKFRGKDRGRFVLTREQVKAALGVERLHATTVEALQDAALKRGLVIVDLDDLFPCVETRVIRKYRRPPTEVFDRILKSNGLVEEETVGEEEADEE